MDSPPRTSSESRTPLVQPHNAPTSDSAAQNAPRLQGGLSEHAAWKIPSAPKEKGKDVCCPSSGRNICVSADGTLGEFGERNSNVVELQSRIEKDENQLTYYISGVGTYDESEISRWWDSAVASSFQRSVLKAYKWLCNSYQPGDRIFLFGFSRGAYQVRVIAGIIKLVGLLYKGNHSQLRSVFKLYMNTMDKTTGSRGTPEEETPALKEAKARCETFKRAFSQPNVEVHFVGVWDTVSSIGITRRPCLPETADGMQHVCHFRQALALDERRVSFWPEYANQSPTKQSKGGDVKEVWFAGSHSDIGGWNTQNSDLDSFGPALRWITYEAMSNGLRMLQHTKGWKLLKPKQSLRGLWHVLEYLPLRRPSYKHVISYWPHNGAARQIQDKHRIHSSVFEAMGIKVEDGFDPEAPFDPIYQPLARFSDGNITWKSAKSFLERLERDPFASAEAAVEKLRQAVDSNDTKFEAAIQVLKAHVSSKPGVTGQRQGPKPLAEVSTDVSDFLLLTLQGEVKRETKRVEAITVLLSALELVPPDKSGTLQTSTHSKLHTIAAGLRGGVSLKSYRNVVQRHGNKPLRYQWTSPWTIEYVALSGKDVFVGSYGHAATWSDKPNINDTFFNVSPMVMSVEISGDGSRCATGHRDGSIRWWDRESHSCIKTMGAQDDYGEMVFTVTLSSDKSKIASGFTGGLIRIWDPETGEEVCNALAGHTDSVNEVAFSADGSQLVSCSDDLTIRLWDTRSGSQSSSMRGHRDRIWSVAFSPCETQIISSSEDKTIRIWNIESGATVKTLEGHTQWVYYATFSPKKDFIASGAGDGTVRVWDASSGETLITYDTGSPVRAVAFSADGKRIVAGCHDGYAYIWDAGFLL